MPAVNFVAGNDCDGLLAVGTRANRLLNEVCANGDFLAIIDRDYRDDAERERIEKGHFNRVFLWQVHEIENLFLQPKIVYETLRFSDQLGTFCSENDVLEALRDVAKGLRIWIAADWVRWEIHQQTKGPSGFIAALDPIKSLHEYGESARAGTTVGGGRGN